MFKSVFAKYVTVFMTIMTLGFVILLLIVTSTVSYYSTDAKTDLMNQVASILREDLEGHLEQPLTEEPSGAEDPSEDEENPPSSGTVSVPVPIEISQEAETSMKRIFSAFSFDSRDKLAVWISDLEGNVLFTIATSDEKHLLAYREKLPREVTSALSSGEEYLGTVNYEPTKTDILIRGLGIFYENGQMCGMIVVGSSNIGWGSMVENLSKTVMTAALLVILVALVAAYFITEFTVKPLREMNRAARKFAAGKFESRVVVRGKDEVAQLAEAFNQMAESLENLETMRNSFVANVSHDLRTPMTTISGFIDAIRDGVIPPDQVDHYLEVISKEIHRLSRLVATLLDLSRLQTGDRKFFMKPFDICEMARVIVISFEKQIEEKRLEVDFQCEQDRLYVMADHDAIYQVFYNLCHNAVKFSKEGGRLRIRIQETRGKKIQISVYNEGEGIPRSDIPMVFERFYKSDKSRGLDKAGLGLGLFISKTIITAHKEKIWVTSQGGRYCEFFFTLPRSPYGIPHGTEE